MSSEVTHDESVDRTGVSRGRLVLVSVRQRTRAVHRDRDGRAESAVMALLAFLVLSALGWWIGTVITAVVKWIG